jgi:hypothetical protein
MGPAAAAFAASEVTHNQRPMNQTELGAHSRDEGRLIQMLLVSLVLRADSEGCQLGLGGGACASHRHHPAGFTLNLDPNPKPCMPQPCLQQCSYSDFLGGGGWGWLLNPPALLCGSTSSTPGGAALVVGLAVADDTYSRSLCLGLSEVGRRALQW